MWGWGSRLTWIFVRTTWLAPAVLRVVWDGPCFPSNPEHSTRYMLELSLSPRAVYPACAGTCDLGPWLTLEGDLVSALWGTQQKRAVGPKRLRAFRKTHPSPAGRGRAEPGATSSSPKVQVGICNQVPSKVEKPESGWPHWPPLGRCLHRN